MVPVLDMMDGLPKGNRWPYSTKGAIEHFAVGTWAFEWFLEKLGG
jgi:hypothetical protein